MKKLKIMLLSLALFAVVGGALAFKAKFHTDFCTSPAYQDPISGTFYCSFQPVGANTIYQTCPNKTLATTFTTVGIQNVCTTLPAAGLCTNGTTCAVLTSIKKD